MHLQRTINTRSCKSGGGASGNRLVFAAPFKRILGDMQPTNGTSISIAPQSCRGNYLDHEKVVICNLVCYWRIKLGGWGAPPPLLFFFFYQNRPFCPLRGSTPLSTE